MAGEPYGTLAGVYEWLVPDAVLTPARYLLAYEQILEQLGPGARVLDCAAGTGQLAVGLRLRGFDVVASDASAAMLERANELAADHGVDLETVPCRWEQLVDQGWAEDFDAVFCVGNSLMHAPGQEGRQHALAQMAAVLRPDGLLAVASRNWELVRARGSGLTIADAIVERGGRRGIVVYAWSLPDGWDERHEVDVAVALIETADSVVTHAERLAFWPFRHQELDQDLRAAGLSPTFSTYAAETERYLVTARRDAQSSADRSRPPK